MEEQWEEQIEKKNKYQLKYRMTARWQGCEAFEWLTTNHFHICGNPQDFMTPVWK